MILNLEQMMTIFQKPTEQERLNDLLFAHRNKAYGAYALRAESDYFLKKALIAGVAIFGSIISVSTLYLQSHKVTQETSDGFVVNLKPVDTSEPEVQKKKIEPQPITKPIKAEPIKTLDTRVPDPTRTPVEEKPLPTVTDLKTAASGIQDKEGVKPSSSVIPDLQLPTNSGIVAPNQMVTPKPNNEIQTKVDVEAKFIGGINNFRTKVSENFDPEVLTNKEGIIKAVVTFVVEKDGSISDIRAEGSNPDFNKEAERAIKKIRERWEPAKIKGTPVRSYFRIPVSMRFE